MDVTLPAATVSRSDVRDAIAAAAMAYKCNALARCLVEGEP